MPVRRASHRASAGIAPTGYDSTHRYSYVSPLTIRPALVRYASVVLLLWFAVSAAYAQPVSSPRHTHELRLTPEAGPEYPIERFAIPASFRLSVNGVDVDSTGFSVETRRNIIYIDQAVLDTAEVVLLRYRTIPFSRSPEFTFVDTTTIPRDTGAVRTSASIFRGADTDPFAGVSLQRRGSITRGVSAGSNRDVGIESGLRLELSGEIADGVGIRALLSDQNTPIVPEGTTRRLEEFDRVLIEIDAPVGAVTLGDVDHVVSGPAFARLSRRVQGAAVSSRVFSPEGGRPGGFVRAAGAVSRGRFRSQVLNVQEGVQGPYRLTGAEGEPFVLVIPGSETIYWDGVPLTRGENDDYVVDYATGEIRFTSNRIVSEERRVLAEFEYSTSQFTRTLVSSHAEVHFWEGARGPRVRIGSAFIQEADGSRFLDEAGLRSADSLALAQAGDSPSFRSGAERVVFDPEAPFVQYILRDTLRADGSVDTFFVAIERRPEAGESVYRVRFTHVGDGLGDYIRAGHTLNGIAYEYVGRGRGSYLPVRRLPQPMQHNLFDVYGSVAVIPNVEVFGEWARSFQDLNRLSPLDAEDDAGSAYEAGVRVSPIELWERIEVSGMYRHRRLDRHFSPFDRIRPVEFGRQWNLDVGSTPASGIPDAREATDEVSFRLSDIYFGDASFEAARFNLGDHFSAERRAMTIAATPLGLSTAEYQGEWIDSRNAFSLEDGNWQRHLGSVRMPIPRLNLTPGLEIEHEDRRQRHLDTDSLTAGAFRFTRITPGVQWHGLGLDLGAEISFRDEDGVIGGQMIDADRSTTVSSDLRFDADRLSGEARIGYRTKTYSDRFRAEMARADQNSLLIRSAFRWRPHPRAVDANVSYEASSERTPLLQEIYIRTGPELGEYVWEDFNGDGIIQIDELIPERTPNEGVYARTFVPTDSLVSSISVNARAELRLDGNAAWRGNDGWQGVLSHISSRSVVEVLETTRAQDITRIYLLHLPRYRDPDNTINGRLRILQDISLWPRGRRGGVDLTHSQVRSLNNRTAGLEEQFISTWRIDARWQPGSAWTTRLGLARERNRQDSRQFASRQFSITGFRLEPEVIFRAGDRLRFSTPVSLAWKHDARQDRSARVARLPLDVLFQVPRRLSWNTRLELANVNLTGDYVGMAQYELTDGRGPGTSWMWGSSLRYSINQYLRVTLQYDGRSATDAPVVHALRMEISVVF